jgi:hypothetical protein
MHETGEKTEPEPEVVDIPKPLLPDVAPVEHHHKSWWWGVIPAVAAIVILLMWATGQFEEVFGIDPRGTWHGETVVEPPEQSPDIPQSSYKKTVKWKLLIEDAAGELWYKLYRKNDVVLSGPLSIDENAVYHKDFLGYIHGIYHSDALRFRYSPFAKRRLNVVVFLRTGESYVINFEKG